MVGGGGEGGEGEGEGEWEKESADSVDVRWSDVLFLSLLGGGGRFETVTSSSFSGKPFEGRVEKLEAEEPSLSVAPAETVTLVTLGAFASLLLTTRVCLFLGKGGRGGGGEVDIEGRR